MKELNSFSVIGEKLYTVDISSATYLPRLRAVTRRSWGTEAPAVFDRSVNPILTRGQIMPTTVLLVPPFPGFLDLAMGLGLVNVVKE